MTREADDERIQKALADLSLLISERVAREQRRDQLTGLANDLALEERLNDHLKAGREIWGAFIEIDRFKSVNDKFGYQNADELLKGVAALLKSVAVSFPSEPQPVEVFRPHGDEFFIIGAHGHANEHRCDVIERLLEVVLTKIRSLRIDVMEESRGASSSLSCTVSVGWLVSTDIQAPLSSREVRVCLERAVEMAKRGRDRAVRYSSAFRQRQTVSLRSDCGTCLSSFTVDIVVGNNREDQTMRCPNCHKDIPRPPAPADEVKRDVAIPSV